MIPSTLLTSTSRGKHTEFIIYLAIAVSRKAFCDKDQRALALACEAAKVEGIKPGK